MQNFKEYREVNELFDIDAVIDEMKAIHAELGAKTKPKETLLKLNALFGKYGTKNMNKAIQKFVDEEI